MLIAEPSWEGDVLGVVLPDVKRGHGISWVLVSTV
jgi:hypothetical protein